MSQDYQLKSIEIIENFQDGELSVAVTLENGNKYFAYFLSKTFIESYIKSNQYICLNNTVIIDSTDKENVEMVINKMLQEETFFDAFTDENIFLLAEEELN